jgi:hypothetical protein
MHVDVNWLLVDDDDDEAWGWTCALYAYLHPTAPEILYIGKTDGTTVRGRLKATDKMNFWRDLERERGLFEHRVLIAEISTQARLTRQLLADVESLLIFAIEPWGNIAARRSRIDRPGLVVKNRGRYWPGPRALKDAPEHVEFW